MHEWEVGLHGNKWDWLKETYDYELDRLIQGCAM